MLEIFYINEAFVLVVVVGVVIEVSVVHHQYNDELSDI